MTAKEAKDYMENEIRCIQRARFCDRDCAKCSLVKEEKALIDAFGEAIIALEKQMPKKVIKNEGYWEINCPYCLTDIAEEKGNEYCVICGQRLDWSEP